MAEDVRLAIVMSDKALHRVAGLPVFVRIWRAFESVGVTPSALVASSPSIDAVAARHSLPQVRRVDSVDQLEQGRWVFCKTDVVIDRVLAEQVVSAWQDMEADQALRVGSSICICAPADDWSQATLLEPQGVFVELTGRGSKFAAKRALIRACRKPIEIDGLVCRGLGRPISGWITHVLLELPVTPNMVTALSLLLGLVAAYLVAFEQMFAWGAGLLFASWVLDNCDGEIARTKHLGSTWGAWFDIYADFITNEAFILAMGVGLSKALGQRILLWVGVYATVVLALYNAVVFAYIHRLGIPDEFLFQWWFDRNDESRDGPDAEEQGLASDSGGEKRLFLAGFFSYAKYLGRRDFFIFFYFVCAVAGVLDWALWATAVGATFTGILTVGHLILGRGHG